MANFPFSEEKTVSVILYILQELGGTCGRHKMFKILYFADQKHLAKFGRPVIGDTYYAMEAGPVPSITYNGVKTVSGEEDFDFPVFEASIITKGKYITQNGNPDMDELSKSDIEILNESIAENRNKSYDELIKKSHQFAYNKAPLNRAMDMLDIAHEGGASEGMVKYIKENAADHHICL